jgi:uncharacterized protein (DUF1800 family)
MAIALDTQQTWSPYRPDEKNPWTVQKVAHLSRRAGFGADAARLREGLEAGPEKLVDRFLQGDAEQAEVEASFDRRVESVKRLVDITQASAWWVARMLQSRHPLREKLCLFWHNHFATSFAKVQNIGQMLGQYQLIYRHALGNFKELLQGMSKDPAMMVWLDTVESKKGKPNENYARELMELFSLGIGNYTEKDIREAARAFTGGEVRDGKYFFNEKEHDASSKKVFGNEGVFNGEGIVNLCLEKKACSKFIVGKLYRYLISETEAPTPELIAPLCESFAKDYDILKLVEKMLRSNLFFSEVAYRQRIKSPVDFLLGLVRGLEGRVGASTLARDLETLGQSLFQPPSVKGWDGGPAWLNGQTLLFRNNLALSLCQSRQASEGGSLPLPLLLCKNHRVPDTKAMLDFFVELFLQNDLAQETTERLNQFRDDLSKQTYPAHWSEARQREHAAISLCHVVLTVPEYQLD